MSDDPFLSLGGVTFQGFEIPDGISFGGEQVLSVHQLIGGVRVIDAMGASEDPIRWEGRFRGPDGMDRARAIDGLRKAGAAINLAWADFSMTVVVKRFFAETRGWEIPYQIEIEVVTAQTSSPAQGPGVDEMVGDDFDSISGLAGDIGGAISDAQSALVSAVSTVAGVTAMISDPRSALLGALNGALGPLPGLVGTLGSALDAVPDFATADGATLLLVHSPLVAVQGCLDAGIGAAEAAIADTPILGDLGAGPLDMAASIQAATTAMTVASKLYDAKFHTGRLATNLASIGASGAVQTVAGANLFAVAAQVYGDASEWSTIARANGLTDPELPGIRMLTIPPVSGKTGGVLRELFAKDAGVIVAVGAH